MERPDIAEKNDGMLYERTAISKKPEELIEKDLVALREEDRLTPDIVFRDPYSLTPNRHSREGGHPLTVT